MRDIIKECKRCDLQIGLGRLHYIDDLTVGEASCDLQIGLGRLHFSEGGNVVVQSCDLQIGLGRLHYGEYMARIDKVVICR